MRWNGRFGLLAVACLASGVLAAGGDASLAADKIGKVTQPLVLGTEVSPAEQQQQTLVTLKRPGGSCSGSLLNSEWVISAAHCFAAETTAGQVTVTASWPTKQTRTGSDLVRLDNDIAILRVVPPFDEVAPGYNMPVFTGTLTPGRALTIYGRGIHILATGEGATARESQKDGKYRTGSFQVAEVDDSVMIFGPGKGGAIPAAGDSGGPAFINAGGQTTLAGVGSTCRYTHIDGKPTKGFTWVDSVSDCSYVRVGAVWPEIRARIGSAGCRAYAWRAIGALEMARDVYGCAPVAISGARWSANFDDHLNWCMSVPAATANAEDKARTEAMHACRMAAAMPQGTGALTVAEAPDGFTLSGGGYPVNSRIIIRVKGAAAIEQNITSNFSDPQGNFAATLSTAKVCATAGPIIFTAEDQDRPASPPVTMTCKAGPAAGAADGGAPPPQPQPEPAPLQPAPKPLKKFVAVALDVDLYDAPGGGGQGIGMLHAGTTGVRLVRPCNDGWCRVVWPDGQGWVYSGPGYQSLNLP